MIKNHLPQDSRFAEFIAKTLQIPKLELQETPIPRSILRPLIQLWQYMLRHGKLQALHHLALVFLLMPALVGAEAIPQEARVIARSSGANVRSSAGGTSVLYTVSPGTTGTIKSGPILGVPIGGSGTRFDWYFIDWDWPNDTRNGWSSTTVFDYQPPLPPVVDSPGTEDLNRPEEVSGTEITLKWSPVTALERSITTIYTVFWRDLDDPNLTLRSYSTTDTKHTTTLVPGHNYKWNVLAINGTLTSAISDSLWFKVKPRNVNLVPRGLDYWPRPIVLSRESGTATEASKIYLGETLYADVGVRNIGEVGTDASFVVSVALNETSLTEFRSIALSPNFTTYLQDITVPANRLHAGKNYISITVDNNAEVPETNETDNTYVLIFDVIPTIESPENLIAEYKNGTVKLAWQYGGNDQNGFVIERIRTEDASISSFSTSASSREYHDNSPLLGQEYCYRIKATNTAVASPLTASVCLIPQVAAQLSAFFVTDTRTPQPGQLVKFQAVSLITGSSYEWFVDGSRVFYGSGTALLAFNSSGEHVVKLEVTSAGSRVTHSTTLNVQSSVTGTGTGGSSGNIQPVHRADPVNLASGSYFFQHTDLRFPGIGIPLEFTRHYDSKVTDIKGFPLGFGWNYTPFISVKDNVTNAIVFYGDGHSELHTATSNGYVGDPGVLDLLFKNPDGSWQVVTKQQTTNYIDAPGRLVRIEDRNGNAVTLDYETDPAAQGRLKRIIDTVGRNIIFHPYVDNPALIGRIEDVLGRSTWFTYDASTNMVRVTNVVDKVTRFSYNEFHQITDAWDNRGNLIVHNDYDAVENTVTNQVDAFGKTTRFIFEFPSRLTTQINAQGHPAFFRFDHRLLLTNFVDEAGFTTSYLYEDDDKDRNRILIQDRNGNVAHLAYDERGNVTNKLDALNQTSSTTYDSRNNPTSRIDAFGNKLTIGYDPHGNVRFTTNALGFVTEISYLPNGLPKVITDSRGFSVTNVWENGSLVETTDALGNTTRMQYDAAGRRILLIDALGRTNRFAFDEEDNLIHTVDALGQTNFIAYDANRNPISSLNPRGANSTNEYDLRDRLIRIIDPLGYAVTNLYDDIDRKVGFIDQRGNETRFEFNRIGHLLAVTNALNQVTQFRRDPNGNPTNVVDEANNITRNWFDGLDRLYASVDPRGSTNLTEFDALSRVTTTTNANGQVTRFRYDALSRLTNIVDTLGGNISFVYDQTGNRIHTVDPRGHTWTNRFDPLGRLIEQINPRGDKTVLQYDAVGNLTKRITPNGASIAFQHDALNRMTNIVYPDGTSVAFAYDEMGNLTNMVDAVGTTSRSFDLLDRLLRVKDPFGQIVSNRFDAAGNRIVLRYPDNKEVSYGYDTLNRMVSLTNWLGGEVHYTRDERGLVIHTVNANSTTADMGYDPTGRSTAITNWSSAGSIIASQAVLLDALGNQTNMTGFKALVPILSETNVSYNFDADNRLASLNGKIATHDKNGNLIGLGSDSYRFDFDNRLLSYAVGGVFGGQHQYDGLGNRLQHTTNGMTRRFVLDRLGSLSQVLVETDDGGTASAYYVYGIGLAHRIAADGQIDTYHYDLQGSSVLITSPTGDQVAAYAYDLFGALADSEELYAQPFRYLGRHGILDDGNGLYHARARYFSPYLGRFISQDPLWGNDSSSQSFNRYAYALNNPFRYFDVTGLTATESHTPQYDPGTAALEAQAAYQEAFDKAFQESPAYYILSTLSIAGDIAGLALDVITASPKTAITKRTLTRVAVEYGDDAFDFLKIANKATHGTEPLHLLSAPKNVARDPLHHIFPQRADLKLQFQKIDIDPNQFTMQIPRNVHINIHSGGARGGAWNQAWESFFKQNPGSTASDAYKEAGRLIHQFDLPGGPVIPYRR